jgi:hypothetical protein
LCSLAQVGFGSLHLDVGCSGLSVMLRLRLAGRQGMSMFALNATAAWLSCCRDSAKQVLFFAFRHDRVGSRQPLWNPNACVYPVGDFLLGCFGIFLLLKGDFRFASSVFKTTSGPWDAICQDAVFWSGSC